MSQPVVLPCVAGGLRVDGVAREGPRHRPRPAPPAVLTAPPLPPLLSHVLVSLPKPLSLQLTAADLITLIPLNLHTTI